MLTVAVRGITSGPTAAAAVSTISAIAPIAMAGAERALVRRGTRP